MKQTLRKLSFATAITGIVVGLWNFLTAIITKIIIINSVKMLLETAGVTKESFLTWVDSLANNGSQAVQDLVSNIDITGLSENVQGFLTSEKVTEAIAGAITNGFDTLANNFTQRVLQVPFVETIFGITEGNPAGIFYLQLVIGIIIFALIITAIILAYKKSSIVWMIIALICGVIVWKYSFGLIFIGVGILLILEIIKRVQIRKQNKEVKEKQDEEQYDDLREVFSESVEVEHVATQSIVEAEFEKVANNNVETTNEEKVEDVETSNKEQEININEDESNKVDNKD